MISKHTIKLLVLAIFVGCVACVGINRHVTMTWRPVPSGIAPLESGAVVSIARKQWERGEVYQMGLLTVALPKACDSDRATRLLRNVRRILLAFEADHGMIDHDITIYITDAETFEMPNPNPALVLVGIKTISLTGVACERKEIAVVAGTDDCLPSLYHELCHACLENAGGDHKNPLWEQWDARGEELSRQLQRQWY